MRLETRVLTRAPPSRVQIDFVVGAFDRQAIKAVS
jgi:hypothetical protein